MGVDIAIPMYQKEFDEIYREGNKNYVDIKGVQFEVDGYTAYATCGFRRFPDIADYLRGRLYYKDSEPVEPLNLRNLFSRIYKSLKKRLGRDYEISGFDLEEIYRKEIDRMLNK